MIFGRFSKLWQGPSRTSLLAICLISWGVMEGDDRCRQLSAGNPMVIERLTEDGIFKINPRWSPDGSELLYSQNRASHLQMMRLNLKERGKPQPFSKREEPEYEGNWSPDGKWVVYTRVKLTPGQGDMEVFVDNREGTEPNLVIGTFGRLSHEESPAWSPDGKQIVFVSTRDGNQEIYLCNRTGADLKRLTTDSALDKSPIFSADGERIYFATSRWGDLELASMKADGTDLVRLTESKGLDDYPALSSDGKLLAFVSNRDQNFEIYLLNLSNGHVENATNSPSVENFPAWGVDGQLTFSSNREGGFDLYRQRVDRGVK